MSGEPQTPAVTPEPQAQPELQLGATPADGGAPEGEGAQPAPQETPEEQDKKRQRFDKRFSDLSRAARDAELRAARLEGELSALRTMPRQHEPAPQAPAAPTQPNPADYKGGKFDENYVEDFAAWKAERAVEAAMAKAEAERVQRERTRAVDVEIERGAERLEGTLDDVRAAEAGDAGEYFQNARGVLELAYVPVAQGGLPRHVVDLITEADNPVHVAEVLGRQPDRLNELRRAHPLKAAKSIGALDASITANLTARKAAPAAPLRAPTPSPAPIPTVTSAGAAPQQDPSKMNMKDYAAWRNSQP